jgi:hypothetical protein
LPSSCFSRRLTHRTDVVPVVRDPDVAGRGGRAHLMSPAMAAAAAVTGSTTDVRDLVA